MSTSGSTKKPDVAPSNKQDLMPARELFYPNDPLVGSLLSLNPFALYGLLMLAAVLVLILFAKAVGILSIPQASGNLGFWFSYNWSIMYLFIVPLIFAIASSSTRSLPRRLKAVANPTGCIVPSNDDAKSDYSADFREEFKKGSVAILVGALVVAVVVDGWDSRALWSALIHKSPVTRDWSTAYALGVTNGWHPPSWGANLAFDIVAYLFQGAYMFLAFYWVAKCGFFFFTFAKMVWKKKYKFNPMDSHPSLRMGLRPLSPFFNNFLVMTSLFLAFILYHRFQLMRRDCHLAFPDFVSQVLHGMKDASFILDFNQKIYGLECLDTGMTLLLVFLVIPIVVIASFPLGIFRHYAAERRDEKLQELGAKLQEALEGDPNSQANANLVKSLDDRIKRLQKACVWPNGDRAALYFLGTIVVLALGAWLPPLLVILGATGLGGIVLHEVREIAKLRES